MLKLTGELDNGRAYTASFGVRKTRDGRVVSSYPIYWTGVDFGPEPPTQCGQEPCPPHAVAPTN